MKKVLKESKKKWVESGDPETTNAVGRQRKTMTREQRRKGVTSGGQNEEEKQTG